MTVLTATECHLPSEITQCYLSLDTSEQYDEDIIIIIIIIKRELLFLL